MISAICFTVIGLALVFVQVQLRILGDRQRKLWANQQQLRERMDRGFGGRA